MARIDVPIKVQLGCDDCHRFLLKKTAEFEAEIERLRAALQHVAVHGDHDQECQRPPQDCAADALEYPDAFRSKGNS